MLALCFGLATKLCRAERRKGYTGSTPCRETAEGGDQARPRSERLYLYQGFGEVSAIVTPAQVIIVLNSDRLKGKRREDGSGE